MLKTGRPRTTRTRPAGESTSQDRAVGVEEESQRSETTIEAQLEEEQRLHARLLMERQLRDLRAQNDALRQRSASGTPSSSLSSDDEVLENPRKRKAQEVLVPVRVKRTLRPEKLKDYHGKNVKEHMDFRRSAEIAFRMAPEDFPRDQDRILYAMQYLSGEPRDAWARKESTIDIGRCSWEYFMEYLLDLVEDPVNRQLSTAQAYMDASQNKTQSVHSFAAYLDTLEAQLPPYTEAQRVNHFLTKLRPSIRQALTNYQDLPTTRSGLEALAARLETNMRGHGASENKATEREEGDRYKKKKKDRERNNNRQGDEDKGRGSRDRTRGERPARGQRSADDRVASRKKYAKEAGIMCHNCSKTGHYASDCMAPARSDANKTAIGNIASKNTSPPPQAQRRRGANQS